MTEFVSLNKAVLFNGLFTLVYQALYLIGGLRILIFNHVMPMDIGISRAKPPLDLTLIYFYGEVPIFIGMTGGKFVAE